MHKILTIMLCLTMLTGLTYAEPTYAEDLSLRIDTHDLNTANSRIQPVVLRNVAGRSYAWVVTGSIFFTKESHKWPGAYYDNGILPWTLAQWICQEYRTPYIHSGKLGLAWAYFDPTLGLLSTQKSDTHYKEYTFGNLSETGSTEVEI